MQMSFSPYGFIDQKYAGGISGDNRILVEVRCIRVRAVGMMRGHRRSVEVSGGH